MRKILLILLLICVLTAVQSYQLGLRSPLSNNPREIVGLFRNNRDINSKENENPEPSVQPVDPTKSIGSNETNSESNSEGLSLGGIASSISSGLSSGYNTIKSGVDGVSDLLEDGLNNLNPVALTKFLVEQIQFFANKTLYIYDDEENPVLLKLEIPDFNLLNLLPDLNTAVTFSLYDKQGGNNSFDILKLDDNDTLSKSRFDPQRPTVFITHGFFTSSNGTSVTLVRDAFLKKRDFNVIAVNWSPLSVGSYTVARLMVPRVGTHVGNMINFLYENGMNPNTTELIGHSLGAHVMGFAGQTATPKVNHTIALDPAWPLFVLLNNNQRISYDDAQYVEVIHTNGGLLGLPGATGDYDFYPNGGFFQSGCSGEIFTACSHSRSYKYLSEQIKKEGPEYYAVQCETYQKFKNGGCLQNNSITIMGALDTVGAEKGNYYLDTNDQEPFGLGFIFDTLMNL